MKVGNRSGNRPLPKRPEPPREPLLHLGYRKPGNRFGNRPEPLARPSWEPGSLYRREPVPGPAVGSACDHDETPAMNGRRDAYAAHRSRLQLALESGCLVSVLHKTAWRRSATHGGRRTCNPQLGFTPAKEVAP